MISNINNFDIFGILSMTSYHIPPNILPLYIYIYIKAKESWETSFFFFWKSLIFLHWTLSCFKNNLNFRYVFIFLVVLIQNQLRPNGNWNLEWSIIEEAFRNPFINSHLRNYLETIFARKKEKTTVERRPNEG